MIRKQILEDLIQFRKPIETLQSEVKRLPWDSDKALVTLKATHVQNVLRQYVNGKISAQIVEDWANLIEVREDIKMSQSLADAIFELANPTLHRELSPERTKEIARLLGRKL